MQGKINDFTGFASSQNVLEDIRDQVPYLVQQTKPPLSHAQILNSLREGITPHNLYSKEALRGTSTMHRILRNLLVVLGVPYHQHPNTNRIIWGFVNQFFEADGHREECYRLLQEFESRNAGAGVQNNHVNPGDAAKITQAKSSKFRLEKDKFEGRLEDNFNDALASYSEICKDLGLSQNQKFQFMHNLFTGVALRFYRDNVEDVATGFCVAKTIMQAEHNSITRQNRCRSQLQKLRLSHVMRKEKKNTAGALEYIRDEITKMAGQ